LKFGCKPTKVIQLPTPHPNPLPQGEREFLNISPPLMGGDLGEGENIFILLYKFKTKGYLVKKYFPLFVIN